MITRKKTVRKVVLAAGAVAMGVGLASAISFEAKAQSGTGGSCIQYCDFWQWSDCQITYPDGSQVTCYSTRPRAR